MAQTYPAFEIIVVDDGSPDDTAAVVAPYSMVQYVYQHNQDVSAARNTGIKHASGKYVVFLDGDDRLLTHALETGVRYLDANPDCAFIAREHRYISESGPPLESIEQQRRVIKDYYRELLHRNFIGCPATVMHRRDVLEAVGGFDTNINPTGDWDLYLRIAHRFPICSGLHEDVLRIFDKAEKYELTPAERRTLERERPKHQAMVNLYKGKKLLSLETLRPPLVI